MTRTSWFARGARTATGGWGIASTLGIVLLASMLGVASQAATDRACVKSCKSEKSVCRDFFNSGFTTSRSDCKLLSGAERRSCIKAAKAARREGRGRCKTSFKADCKPCCAGADTSGCSVRVCGDEQQVAGEECEPPGTASCDDQCRTITTTTTTSTTSTITTLTTTTTTSTTTTTIPGVGAAVQVSPPPNGMHFVPGDEPLVTVVLNDDDGSVLTLDQLSAANLYMYGPQDQSETMTAVALLRASPDRNQGTHHYVNLKTNPDVIVDGNVLFYPLSAVTDELPGTYTVTVWAVLATDRLQQWMPATDLQIGTPDVETQIVEKEKCAACHLGAASDKFYLHHIDPGFSPEGNWALDSWPVRTCKSCHNQDGYAAYDNGGDSGDANLDRTPDPIIFRAHGVHNGGHLENIRNEEVFADYLHVIFPADVRNCATCHVDDRWKTEPSRQACGACHDNIWFGDASATPEGMENHPGGARDNDNSCFVCHPPDGPWTPPFEIPIATVHAVDLSTDQLVELSLSPPDNDESYEAGETPTLTVVVRDAATLAVVDPNTITQADWSRARLQVSGPREDTMPVLTSAAANRDLSGSTSYVYNDLRVRTDPADEDPNLTRSATEITYQLADVDGLEPGTYTVFVQVRESSSGGAGVEVINFQVGTATEEAEIATNCTDCHGNTNMHGSYPFALAPDLCKSCHDYEKQLDGRTGWDDGSWGFGAAPLSRRVHGVHFGRYLDKPEEIHGEEDADHYGEIIFPQDVRNCVKCHAESDAWTEEPSRIACLGCHDSDAAQAHGYLNTLILDPLEPYGPMAVESCEVCHGADADFAPSVVHNISDPYVPPYPREPAE